MSETKKETLLRNPETGQFPLTMEILPDVIELGRLFHKTVLEWAQAKGKENLHIRVIEHAANYLALLHQEKKATLADDFLRTERLIRTENLGEIVAEPYTKYIEAPQEDTTTVVSEEKKEEGVSEAVA